MRLFVTAIIADGSIDHAAKKGLVAIGQFTIDGYMNEKPLTKDDVFWLMTRANDLPQEFAWATRKTLRGAIDGGETAFVDANVFGYAKELLRRYPEVFGTDSKA